MTVGVVMLVHTALERAAQVARHWTASGCPVVLHVDRNVPRQTHRAFVDALHHFGIGVSWGGYESLVLPVTPQRSAGTWTEDGQLVRFNIGLEDTDSLKADLAAALPLLNTASE